MLKSISKVTPCSLSGIKQMGGVQMEMTKTGINEEAEVLENLFFMENPV